ncbi:MAG: hypothetical protein HY898_06200 [Deltaproteobacteria bacterium]|nr:hypothetical protein [Deltaproteobacteria bacterium]
MRSYVLRRSAWSMTQVALVCIAIALVAALIRLLPWLASSSVPSRATLVFAQALALAALEVALIVAPAVGASLDVARSTASGSTLALFSLGFGPARHVAHIAVAAACAAALSLAVSFAWGIQASRPGQLTNEMIASGRTVCADQRPAQTPLVGITWLCVSGEPVMVGSLGSAGQAPGLWSASQASFVDDLSSVRLRDVRASFRKPEIHAQFADVTITGLVPWVIASPTAPLARGLACALACVAAAVGAAWALLRRPCTSRAVALAVGASGPAAFLLAAPWMLGQGSPLAVVGTTLMSVATPVVVHALLSRPRLLALLQGGTNS